MTPQPRPRSLRFHLAALVLASTTPLVIFAVVLALLLGRTPPWMLLAAGVAALVIAAAGGVIVGGRIARGVATLSATYVERLRVLHEIDAAIIAAQAPVAVA